MADSYKLFPTQRLSATDGLSITGAIWSEAHDYHRRALAAHTVGLHSAGIITGLQVVASRPPDTYLNVQPGVAVDSLGQVIIVPKLQARNLDTLDGLLYLILEFYESPPHPVGAATTESDPRYVAVEFRLQVTTTLPDRPYVELARLQRRTATAHITNASDPTQPVLNEIDLRFRQEIGHDKRDPILLGVIHLGDDALKTEHVTGIANLARVLRQSTGHRIWVEPEVALKSDLARYTMLWLVSKNGFLLSMDEQTQLRLYVQNGGTLFCEGCRQDTGGRDPAAHKNFLDLIRSLKVVPQEVPPLRPTWLDQPHLFSTLPEGYESKTKPLFTVADGVILSNCDYGCLWQGKRRDRMPTRNEIRDTLELGENLLAYALRRREERQARS